MSGKKAKWLRKVARGVGRPIGLVKKVYKGMNRVRREEMALLAKGEKA